MGDTQLSEVKQELEKHASPVKAASFPRFFKAGPGEYAEGDQFIGVTVPHARTVAKQFQDLSFADTQQLLRSPIHEHRLTALFILVQKYTKGDAALRQRVVDLYLKNLAYVNNWDLVDSSAPSILGPHLYQQDPQLLHDLTDSGHLWRQRIAVLATYYFIKQGEFTLTLQLAKKLLNHPHDLIHKAVGWMLREIGNRDQRAAEAFLQQHYQTMPRTMLRYAIEKFPLERRTAYLEGRV